MRARPRTAVSEDPAPPDPRGADDVRELDRVAVTADVRGDDGEEVPAGSVGTVVGVWGRSRPPEVRAYEVEFSGPVDALATVPAALVRVVGRAAD